MARWILTDGMIERDESRIKREMRAAAEGRVISRETSERLGPERDTTEQETDGQIDGSLVCITE